MSAPIPICKRPVLDLPVAGLKLHPRNKNLPRWADNSDEWIAFCQDILQNGIAEPLLVVDRKHVASGGTRLKAALEVGLKTVPAREVTEDEVPRLVLRDWHRQPRTKTQLAYLLASDDNLVAAALAEGKRRREANINGEASRADSRAALTVSELAAENGISKRLFAQALEVVAYFKQSGDELLTFNEADHPMTMRDYWEPRILSIESPKGFKDVLCGAGAKLAMGPDHGGRHTIDKPRQLELWHGSFETTVARLTTWMEAEPHWRKMHLQKVRDAAAALPQDRCTALADYYADLAAACRQAGRQAKGNP